MTESTCVAVSESEQIEALRSLIAHDSDVADAARKDSAARHRRQQAALAALTRCDALQSGVVKKALRQMCETAARTLGVARVGVWRYNADYSVIRCVELFELETACFSSGIELRTADYPAYFRAIGEANIVDAHDAANDPRTREFDESYFKPLGITSMMDAPTHLHDRVDGVLCHEHVGPMRKWTPDEQTFAIAVSNLVSLALSRADRDEAQRALKQAEAQFESLVHSVDGIVWEADARTFELTFVSRQAERLLGFPLPRWREPNFWADHIHPDDRGRMARYTAESIAQMQDHKVEYRMIASDGATVWFNDNVTVVRDGGEITRLRGIMVDVTNRRRAEDALRTSEEQYRALIENAQDVIFNLNGEGRLTALNPVFESVTGWTREKWIGRPFMELVHPDDLTVAVTRFFNILNGETTPLCEYRVLRKDGTYANGEFTLTAMKHEGKIVGVFGIARDVTERKQLEDQLRQSQKLESLGQLAGGVAHDFNNLLTVIDGYATLLTAAQKAPEDIEAVQQISQAAGRGANLTRQLLMFSRKQIIRRISVDLTEVVSQVSKMLRRVLGEHITLTVQTAAGLPFVHADAGMMEQVLLNLAVNARDAMPSGGELVIQATEVTMDEQQARLYVDAVPGRFICLLVRDTGCGISPEVLPHIFEPFYTTKSVGKGTGLGLATVHGIIKQHQGWMRVETETGRGAIFRIYLPVVGSGKEAAPKQPANLPKRGSETVLVVEDETSVRDLVAGLLARHGYQVITAPDGPAALELWKQSGHRVHLLLTDLVMPGGISGFQLADRLTKEKPGLKVIYTSGYSDEIADHPTILGQGNHFLQKPYAPQTLARIVRDCLDT